MTLPGPAAPRTESCMYCHRFCPDSAAPTTSAAVAQSKSPFAIGRTRSLIALIHALHHHCIPCPPPMSRRFAGVSESGSPQPRSRAQRRTSSIHAFDDHGYSLSPANASRSQPILLLPPPQFIQQRNHQPRARRAQRMSQRNRPAIHIHFLPIQP